MYLNRFSNIFISNIRKNIFECALEIITATDSSEESIIILKKEKKKKRIVLETEENHIQNNISICYFVCLQFNPIQHFRKHSKTPENILIQMIIPSVINITLIQLVFKWGSTSILATPSSAALGVSISPTTNFPISSSSSSSNFLASSSST